MIDLNSYMHNVGVSRKSYVKKWIEEDLIPGVISAPDIDSCLFPNSARRPYKYRSVISAKSNASSIRAHILKATIDKQYISHEMCYSSQIEFQGFVNDLVGAGLITERKEDGRIYLDSTLQCDSLKNKTLKELRSFLIELFVNYLKK